GACGPGRELITLRQLVASPDRRIELEAFFELGASGNGLPLPHQLFAFIEERLGGGAIDRVRLSRATGREGQQHPEQQAWPHVKPRFPHTDWTEPSSCYACGKLLSRQAYWTPLLSNARPTDWTPIAWRRSHIGLPATSDNQADFPRALAYTGRD